MTLKKVRKALSISSPITAGVKRYHYIFVVPTDWEHEIRDEIIRPVFRQAGFINDTDYPCRLLFYTKLDALKFDLQNKLYSFTIDYTKVAADVILERGKHYMLYDTSAREGEEEVLIRSHSFETIQTNVRVDSKREFFIMDPSSVYSSKYYPLISLNTVIKNMTKLLQDKGPLLPSVDI
jgi:hypothetical protein